MLERLAKRGQAAYAEAHEKHHFRHDEESETLAEATTDVRRHSTHGLNTGKYNEYSISFYYHPRL